MKIKEVWSRLNYLALIWNQSYNFTGREAPNYGRTRKETLEKTSFFFLNCYLKKINEYSTIHRNDVFIYIPDYGDIKSNSIRR